MDSAFQRIRHVCQQINQENSSFAKEQGRKMLDLLPEKLASCEVEETADDVIAFIDFPQGVHMDITLCPDLHTELVSIFENHGYEVIVNGSYYDNICLYPNKNIVKLNKY